MPGVWLTDEVPTIRRILHRRDEQFRASGGTYSQGATRQGVCVSARLELTAGRIVEACYYGGDFFDVVYAGRVYTFPWDLAA